MKLIREIIQGAGDLEGYGKHPGTILLFGFTLMGGIAGIAKGGIWGFIGGSLIMFFFMFPVWCVGCIGRARDYQRAQAIRARGDAE